MAGWQLALVCGGGSALAVVTVGLVLAVMASGGGSAEPSPASVTASAGGALVPCAVDDVTFQLAAVPQPAGVELVLDASGAKPCRLRVVASLALRALATMDPAVAFPNLNSLSRTFILTRDFPSSGTFAEWDWDNWCGTTDYPFGWQLDLAATVGAGLRQPIMLDMREFPPCRDANAGSTLSLRDATPGADSPAMACPAGIPADVCSFAFNLATTLQPDDIAALVGRGAPTTYHCDSTNVAGELGSPQVCTGQLPGTDVRGFHLAMHGSEGQTLSPADFTKALQDEFDTIVPRFATIGCTVISARCIDFVVAFATGKRSAAVYLAFGIQPGGTISLTGAGLSGDNAPTILTGGRTMSVIGETNFVPVNPAP